MDDEIKRDRTPFYLVIWGGGSLTVLGAILYGEIGSNAFCFLVPIFALLLLFGYGYTASRRARLAAEAESSATVPSATPSAGAPTTRPKAPADQDPRADVPKD